MADEGDALTERGTLLLVTAVRLRRGANGLQLDDQTCAGLCRWAEHFSKIVYAGILLETQQEDATSTVWIDIETLPCADQLTIVALPMSYKLAAFARNYRETRQRLSEYIRTSDHLCFTIGYLVGDWAAVAAREAIRQGRKYAVWFDRVEHQVLRNILPTLALKRRLKEGATLLVMERYHRYLTRQSSLALLQGMDTFQAYASDASNPFCVYDVHTHREDFASADDIEEKLAEIRSGAPLRIVYVGRAAEMKGPFDWLRVLALALEAKVSFRATWLGDGPLLKRMEAGASELGVSDNIVFAGHVGDRGHILGELRKAHIFLFCHKTPESPRCLIEALVSAVPIVGYRSSYAAGLVQDNGGGRLAPLDDVAALSSMLIELDKDRPALAELVKASGITGRQYDEETLYRQRAQLIASHA